jgi:hypothetical protein
MIPTSNKIKIGANRESIVGQIIGNLEILAYVKDTKNILNTGNIRYDYIYKCKCLIDSFYCKKIVDIPISNLRSGKSSHCGAYTCSSKFNNIFGKRFGKLLVVGFDGFYKIGKRINNEAYWECLCDCGYGTIVLGRKLLTGDTRSCGCIVNKSHMEITGKYFCHLRTGAKIREIEFDITIEDCWELFVKQNGRCALTGVELKHWVYDTNSSIIDGDVSLDRIDSTKGYIKDNIQWVHKVINIMKSDLEENDFINWCRKVIDNNQIRKVKNEKN